MVRSDPLDEETAWKAKELRVITVDESTRTVTSNDDLDFLYDSGICVLPKKVLYFL